MNIIAFGSLVRDKITGFEGFVTDRVEHMHGCVRYGVQPPLKDGQLPDAKFFDGPDLSIVAPPKNDLPPAIKTTNALKLGVKVKDYLTGFTGIVVLRVKNMHAGDRYGVQGPKNEKNEVPDLKTFDEGDLEQIDPPPKKKKKKMEKKPPYGPHDHSNAIAR